MRIPGAVCEGKRWRASDLYVTIGGPIAADDDAILAAIPKKTRADCRKADGVLDAEESPRLFDAFRGLFAQVGVRIQDTDVAGAADPDVLGWAAQEGRILLTHDVTTITAYARARTESGATRR